MLYTGFKYKYTCISNDFQALNVAVIPVIMLYIVQGR